MQTAASDQTAATDAAEIRDDRGTVFRPGFHRVNADGSPFKGARGQFMPRGGRKRETVTASADAVKTGEAGPLPDAASGQPTPEPSPSPAPALPAFDDVKAVLTGKTEPVPTITPELVESVSHEASAEAVLRGSYALGDIVFSGKGEWQADASEHKGLKESLVATQRALNARPFHPAIMFGLTCLAFVWKTARQPNTAKTLVKWFPRLAPVLGVEPSPEAKEPAKAGKSEPLPAPKPEPAKPASQSGGTRQARAEAYFG